MGVARAMGRPWERHARRRGQRCAAPGERGREPGLPFRASERESGRGRDSAHDSSAGRRRDCLFCVDSRGDVALRRVAADGDAHARAARQCQPGAVGASASFRRVLSHPARWRPRQCRGVLRRGGRRECRLAPRTRRRMRLRAGRRGAARAVATPQPARPARLRASRRRACAAHCVAYLGARQCLPGQRQRTCGPGRAAALARAARRALSRRSA